jgi:mRNA interferase HicA
VKRKELIHYLMNNGAYLLREGRRHSIYQRGKYRTEIPRHNEIMDELAKKICRDLDIPFTKGGF